MRLVRESTQGRDDTSDEGLVLFSVSGFSFSFSALQAGAEIEFLIPCCALEVRQEADDLCFGLDSFWTFLRIEEKDSFFGGIIRHHDCWCSNARALDGAYRLNGLG
jgi:hypothetical protein